MTKQSISVYKAYKDSEYQNNTTERITPTRHRNVHENVADSFGNLVDANTWEGANTFQAGILLSIEEVSNAASTYTIPNSDFINYKIIPATVTTVELPATPTDKQWFEFINESGGGVTLSGNGKNIYTSSNNATRTITTGGRYRVIYSSSKGKWYSI